MNAPRSIKTMCPMNCHPTLCGMEVTVSGDEVRIAGDPTHPDSQGGLCMRGEAAHQIVGNPNRLTTPLIRDARGGELREGTWDEALDRIAAACKTAGAEAVGVWSGHGMAANDYGVGVKGQQITRFANLYGAQRWGGQMICWGLGGFGFGLTGAIDTNTLRDLAEDAGMALLWGVNTASQKNTLKPLMAAKKRGAPVVAIDIRRTEATALADEAFIIRPGSDAALALGVMHVLVAEDLIDAAFIRDHTVGFEALRSHLAAYTPDWAAAETGIEADRIAALARLYGRTRPATIVAGGSSLHKGANGWTAARAIACLPALVGDYGRPGGGMGVRHGVHSHGRGLNKIDAGERRPAGTWVANQMSEVIAAMEDGRVKVMLTFGANPMSSWPDSGRMAAALATTGLVVAYDIFMSETARHADIVLPATIWLEELGVKATGGHIHLCDQALAPAGESRPIYEVLPDLASRLDVEDAAPWPDQETAINAVIAHPSTGGATVEALRAAGGRVPFNVSSFAYPDLKFDTPSGKIEFYSERAEEMGLPPLPVPAERAREDGLMLMTGRDWTHFHSFYDQGRMLPDLAERATGPRLWISPADAEARGIAQNAAIRISNHRGAFEASAEVTDKVPTGTVWMRDGWVGLNRLTDSAPALPEEALEAFGFTVGQSTYAAVVEAAPI